MERKATSLDVRATATGRLDGYGAIFDNTDSYGDVIRRGAFVSTLAAWQSRGKLPPMLLQHGGGFSSGAEDLVPIGVWDSMREDARGLRVSGHVVALDTDLGKRVLAALQAGALDGLSIGFMPTQSKPRTDGGRELLAVDLWELSIVTFPANPEARVTAVKSRTSRAGGRSSASVSPATRDLDTLVGAMRNQAAGARITARLDDLRALSTRAATREAIRGRGSRGQQFTL